VTERNPIVVDGWSVVDEQRGRLVNRGQRDAVLDHVKGSRRSGAASRP
jgi:hypothetical protein